MIKIPYIGLQLNTADDVYLSSDEHLGHKNILAYTGRPYKNVEEMDDDIIRRHNEVIPKENSVWICLGDVSLSPGRFPALQKYLSQMNGETKILLLGNHDKLRKDEYLAAGFDFVIQKNMVVTMRADKQTIYLHHRPLPNLGWVDYTSLFRRQNPKYQDDPRPNYMIFDRDNPVADEFIARPDILPIFGNVICGHVHQIFRHYVKGNAVNVSLDVWDMKPVSLNTVLNLLSTS